MTKKNKLGSKFYLKKDSSFNKICTNIIIKIRRVHNISDQADITEFNEALCDLVNDALQLKTSEYTYITNVLKTSIKKEAKTKEDILGYVAMTDFLGSIQVLFGEEKQENPVPRNLIEISDEEETETLSFQTFEIDEEDFDSKFYN